MAQILGTGLTIGLNWVVTRLLFFDAGRGGAPIFFALGVSVVVGLWSGALLAVVLPIVTVVECDEVVSIGRRQSSWSELRAISVRGLFGKYAVILVFADGSRAFVASMRFHNKGVARAVARAIGLQHAQRSPTERSLENIRGWGFGACAMRLGLVVSPAIGYSVASGSLTAIGSLVVSTLVGAIVLFFGVGDGFVRAALQGRRGVIPLGFSKD
jgi:hypothetical protein